VGADRWRGPRKDFHHTINHNAGLFLIIVAIFLFNHHRDNHYRTAHLQEQVSQLVVPDRSFLSPASPRLFNFSLFFIIVVVDGRWW
jgi:hypothetical protein